MNPRAVLSVANHHTDACGSPPRLDELRHGCYLGYFENQHGEQAIFVFDRVTRAGTLYMGDAGWERPHAVVEAKVPGLILADDEQAWLSACWRAATLA